MPRRASEIRRRHDAGESIRQIARALNLPKSTVEDALRGQRRRRRPSLENYFTPLEPGEFRVDPPVRCADCGGRIIVVPCRACRVEKQRRIDQVVRELAVKCPRCGPQLGRIKGREVRCRRCGKWLQCAPGR